MKDFWSKLKKYVTSVEGDGDTYFQLDEKCMIPETIAIGIWHMFKEGEQTFYDLDKEQDYNRLLRQENESLRFQNENLYDQLNDPDRGKIVVDITENNLPS